MSSQLDNNNSYPGKRARTDGGRREDDWTCPSCGNINFSFRTTCNMRNCTQSRPVNHNMKSAPKPLHVPPAYSSSASYMNSGSPSIYLEGYGFGQYGGRVPVGSPYGPMHLSGPPPYSGQSMMGAGGMYGVPPLMDRYSLGMPMSQGAMGLREAYLDEIPIKRASGCDNDWTCPNCGNQNFAFRNVCNMRKCGTPKPESQALKAESSKGTKSKMPEGSWKCLQCNNINYPFRIKCNRQNCGADKPSDKNESTVVKSDEIDKEKKFRQLSNNWKSELVS